MTQTFRILIVDDTPAIHDDVKKVLGCDHAGAALASFDDMDAELFGTAPKRKRRRVRCDSAFQGEEALRLVEQAIAEGNPYAVAIVDMRMPPGWDGLETLQRLWAVDSSLQAIICSAHSDWTWEEIVEAVGERENLLILKKPFAPGEVSQMVTALTENWSLEKQVRAHMRDRVKEALRLGQRLEALGRLAAGVAHEINNPLTYILHNHEFLLDALEELAHGKSEAPHELLAEAREVMGHTFEGVARIRDIVRNLQTYSRTENYGRTVVDVNIVVRAALANVGEELVLLAPNVQYGALPAVVCAQHRLEEAVTAIVENAVHAVRGQGVRTIEISTRSADSGAVIEIRDSGPGMSREIVERIFDPFFTTKGHDGKGLGLSICRNIIEDLGGNIEVETGVGLGALFRVTLPAAKSEELPVIKLSA